jgi:hypothetical protein
MTVSCRESNRSKIVRHNRTVEIRTSDDLGCSLSYAGEKVVGEVKDAEVKFLKGCRSWS